MPRRLSALVGACHPGPTAGVVAVAAGVAAWGRAAAPPGCRGSTLAAWVATVGAGQLLIGWVNDRRDVERDRAAGRTDKPLVTGALTTRDVESAAAAAAAALVGASLALTGAGRGREAAAHAALVVGSGLAYDLGIKSTAWSPVPFALAFGALPALAWRVGSDGHGRTPPWLAPTGAVLGTAAHLLNTLPDLDDDAATGVWGLPHRLGPHRARALAHGLLLSAATTVVAGTAAGAGWRARALALAGVLPAAAAVAAAARRPGLGRGAGGSSTRALTG